MVKMKDRTPKEEIEFLKYAAPQAQYVMSVCAGSAILAMAGILDGKRATTNKALYKVIVVSSDLTLYSPFTEVMKGYTR